MARVRSLTDINTRSYEIVGLLGHGGFGKVEKPEPTAQTQESAPPAR